MNNIFIIKFPSLHISYVCNYNPNMNILWYYAGEDCIIQMLLELNKLNENANNAKMINIDDATSIHFCDAK